MLYSAIRLIVLIFLALFVLRVLLGAFRGFTGGLNVEELAELKRRNALVLDVRTQAEFADGHVAGSLNIPLNELPDRLKELDPARPILACCASGARSSRAKRILDSAGFALVYNVGPWRNAR